MKRILYILLLFPFLLQGQNYQYKPDFKAMFRTVYEPLIITALDSLDQFVVDAHDLDTAIVTTAIRLDPDADNYFLEWWQGLSTGDIGTGTLIYSGSDSTEIQGRKIPIDVPVAGTNYAFKVSQTGIDTVSNSDTTQLDPIPVSPDFFAGGLLWIEGTDTTQFDSLYVNADSSILSLESDGLLFQIPEGGAGFPEMITDGDFPDATNWTEGTSWTISGGTANYDDVASGTIHQTDGQMVSSIIINTDYRLEFDLVIASGDGIMHFNSSDLGIIYIAQAGYANGHHIIDFTTGADVGVAGFLIRARSSSSNAFTLDNVSIKQR